MWVDRGRTYSRIDVRWSRTAVHAHIAHSLLTPLRALFFRWYFLRSQGTLSTWYLFFHFQTPARCSSLTTTSASLPVPPPAKGVPPRYPTTLRRAEPQTRHLMRGGKRKALFGVPRTRWPLQLWRVVAVAGSVVWDRGYSWLWAKEKLLVYRLKRPPRSPA